MHQGFCKSVSIKLSCVAIATVAWGVVSLVAAARVEPSAAEISPTQTTPQETRNATGTRRALIICGHAGDDEHRKRFAETVDSLRTSLIDRLQFDSKSVWVLFGGEDAPDDAPRPHQVRGPSTQESIAATVADLKAALKPDDSLWVLVIGHSHFDRRHSWFNIPGPDLNEQTFGRLFDGLSCREQVFWITLPASGFYIKPLTATGRVIITATEADREINETTFPHELAKLLADAPGTEELDADKDGTISLLDLYLTLTRRIAQSYADQKQLSTEHAQLDDNGDGRGTEVQLDYLSEELGGRNKSATPPPRSPGADGHLSSQIVAGLKRSE